MRLSKLAAIVCTIMTVLLVLVGIVLFALSGILNPLIQADIESGTFDFDFKAYGTLVQNMASAGKITQALGIWCLYAGIIMLLLTVIFFLLRKIFKSFCISYSPFIREITRDMKVLFVLITLLTLRSSLLIGLILGLALWGMLLIFEYGCYLQNESDETL